MTDIISDITVSVNEQEESEMLAQGYTAVNRNLNKGAGGSKIYLWYKRGSSDPVTRIQLSFSDGMSQTLTRGGYQKIEKNLNEETAGNPIYLLYYKGMGKSGHDIPITKLDVSDDPEDEAKMFKFGWERLACNLNRGNGGTKMYLWVKRAQPTQICDITASTLKERDMELMQKGYIRVDESTNKSGDEDIFIWYCQTSDKSRAITDLKVSTNDEEHDEYERKGYSAVSKNLGNKVKIWYLKGEEAIKAVTVVDNPQAVTSYKAAKVQVIEKPLSSLVTVHLCFYK